MTIAEKNTMIARIRMTKNARNTIDNQELLPFSNVVSRMDELVRLAKVGKQFEEGKLVKEVVVIKEVKEAKPTIARFEEMSNEELRGCQAPGSALEKIRRSVQAIKVYNEQQAEKKYQWAINVSTIEALSGCHSKAVREYLDSDEGRLQVTDYNLEKGLGYHQNKGKGSIKQFVDWQVCDR